MVEVGETASWYTAGAATTADDDVHLFGDSHCVVCYKRRPVDWIKIEGQLLYDRLKLV